MTGDRSLVAQLLCEAIKDMLEIGVLYGNDERTRICHPHVVFEDGAGTLLLDAYQVAGHSSGPLPDWRCLEVNQIQHIEARGRSFQAAEGYNPLNRDRYHVLICWIDSPRLVT